MITVAIAEVFYFVEFNPLSDYTGGENGLPGVPTPSLNLGFTTIQFNSDWSLYVFMAFWYFVGIVIGLRIVRSPVGAILSAIRDNPLRAAAVGHNIHGYKLTAFVIAAAYAGFAGGLLGVLQAFMPPDAFTFETSGQLVMQTAIGGAGTLFGPLVGRRRLAVSERFLPDDASSRRDLEAGARRRVRAAGVLPAPGHHRWLAGLLALLLTRRRRLPPPPRRRPKPSRCQHLASVGPSRRRNEKPFAGPALEARGLTKTFGGLVANRDINFSVAQGELRGDHRPQWRRQEHVLQDADLRDAADVRTHLLSWPRHHRHEGRPRLPARLDQELSGQPALQPADAAREHRDRRAG